MISRKRNLSLRSSFQTSHELQHCPKCLNLFSRFTLRKADQPLPTLQSGLPIAQIRPDRIGPYTPCIILHACNYSRASSLKPSRVVESFFSDFRHIRWLPRLRFCSVVKNLTAVRSKMQENPSKGGRNGKLAPGGGSIPAPRS